MNRKTQPPRRPMQHADWGAVSPRWAGIHSEFVSVGGVGAHYLRAEAAPGSAPNAPTHLLVHSLAAGATVMLDLIRPLSQFGPVIAPDMQGTLFGLTGTPNPSSAGIRSNARFVRRFAAELDLRHIVVHGWSMGAGVAIRFASTARDRTEGIVLASPPLPAPMTWTERAAWQTLGRLALLVGPTLARWLVRLWGKRLIDQKLRLLTAGPTPRAFQTLSEDLSTIPPDTMALWLGQIASLRSQPEKMAYAATAFASVVSGIFINQKAVWKDIDRFRAPVLLLWGENDPLITRPTIDQAMARNPQWDLRVFQGAGHTMPVQMPEDYAKAVGEWLAGIRT